MRRYHHQVTVPTARAGARMDEKVLETPSAPYLPTYLSTYIYMYAPNKNMATHNELLTHPQRVDTG